LNFRNIHIYSDYSTRSLDLKLVAKKVASFFPNCSFEVRPPFFWYAAQSADSQGFDLDETAQSIARTRISDMKAPFDNQRLREHCPQLDTIMYEKNIIDSGCIKVTDRLRAENNTLKKPCRENRLHPEQPSSSPQPDFFILYDGFMLQRVLANSIPKDETSVENVHILFDSRLTCTFSEDDWRYHARAVICGTPSIISVPGIIEGPAKPKEFYIKQIQYGQQYGVNSLDEKLKQEFAKRFIDYNDIRINDAAIGYVLQALFFFLADGSPFCNYKYCRLFNAHWQESLIHSQIKSQKLCKNHLKLLKHFIKTKN
jgi:hypothetical protein